MNTTRIYIGCPEWANKFWAGNFFAPGSKSADYLQQYSGVFNTVEGNTTFYGIPKRDTVLKWRERAAEGFRFCFKFPRTISHDKALRKAEAETGDFFAMLETIGQEMLGPSFLQLPPHFGANDLDSLADYLDQLPEGYAYAVEVRHPDFFDAGPGEEALNELLAELNVNRVLLDSRALHASDAKDEDTRLAKRRKPTVPARRTQTAQMPFVRFIGDGRIEKNRAYLGQWVAAVGDWLQAGLLPYIFLHTPNDHYAPQLARLFHTMLVQQHPETGSMADFPIDVPVQQSGTPSLF